MRMTVVILLVVSAPGVLLAEGAPMTGKAWHDTLQSIGAKYKKGTTQAQNNLRRKQLIEELSALKDVTVQMSSMVKEVRWKNGVAEIYTDAFLSVPERGAPKPPLAIYRTLPFELRMNEEKAASIEPGATIAFRGTLQFHAGKHGAPGRTLKVPQMHTVKHYELPGTPLGTYMSPDCVVAIDGKVFPTKWSP